MTHPVGRRSMTGIHHADDCPMRNPGASDCVCGREGERGPRITDEAMAAAQAAMRGHDCNDVVARNIPHLARVALEAALPHLAPQPTREQIEQRIRRLYIDGGANITHAQEAAKDVADAVLALINGSAS